MTITLTMPELTELKPKITVIGVGGAGGNAVNNMIKANLLGVDFVVANTDAQALLHSKADRRIQLGGTLTQGLGAGARPEVGRAAAEETMQQVMEHLGGSHMLFITAGMGGGTGTGAAPVIARMGREAGMLTVGVVTKPFQFEGAKRMRLAEEGIAELQKYVDTLIIIPNQNLFRVANERTTFADAFAMADEVLQSGVRSITDLMVMPGLVNLDFADVRTVMSEMGKAMMGTGEAEGENRALEAAEAAISNPLLDEVSMKGARGVLINITGGMDLTLYEVDEAANRIRSEVDPEANILVGSALDENLNGRMRVSVVATGIEAADPAATISVRDSVVLRAVNFDKSARTEDVAVAAAAVEEAPVEVVAVAEVTEAADEAYVEAVAAETDAAFVAAVPMEPKTPSLEPVGRPDAYAEAAFTNGAVPEVREDTAPVRENLSWFERVTGRGRRAEVKAEPKIERAAPEPDLFERKAAAAVAPAQPARVEPTANIGRATTEDRITPAARKLEDQLEIPTFLRRQAN